MKETFRKISAVLLVSVLLLSTTSFSIFKHFCNGNMVAISMEKIDNCCKSESVIKSYKLNFSAQDCCKNETSIKRILPFNDTNASKITKSQQLFLSLFYYNFIENSFFIKIKKNFYKKLTPPNLVFNKQVLFQSFLI